MAKKGAHTKTFRVREEDFGAAYTFAKSLLERKDISEEVLNEVMLVFEALFQKLLDSDDLDENVEFTITRIIRLEGFSLRLAFEGKPFDLHADGEDSIEENILHGYDDKLDCSYRAGYNVIDISVSRSYRRRLFACAIAAVLAVLAYVPLHFLLDEATQAELMKGYVLPLETAYANAALMIGAPMTFFSLLKNLTDTYVVSHWISDMKRLQASTITTSIIAILLAVVAGLFWSIPFAGFAGIASTFETTGFDRSFADIVTAAVPPSIFEPFESISPLPLMFVALLVTYALCSAGKYFNPLRQAMEACYTLFSRMLTIVTAGLPFFCFLAFLDVMLLNRFEGLLGTLGYIVVLYASLLLPLASYALRLRAHHIPLVPFARKLMPLIRENLKIGSVIDATPFNIRYCARVFGMDRNRLERNMPTLAQINLDGNCFIIMLIALIFLFITGTDFAWFNIIGLGGLVLFLSLGAPNQPGSILIGTLIVTMYLHSTDLINIAIFFEAFAGSAQNIINVIGNIVMVAIEEHLKDDSLSSEKNSLIAR